LRVAVSRLATAELLNKEKARRLCPRPTKSPSELRDGSRHRTTFLGVPNGKGCSKVNATVLQTEQLHMTRALYCVIHVVCVAALFSATLSAATAEPKRVLLINSYGREFAPWNEYAKEIRSQLQDEWEGPLDIYELSLTTALFGKGERDFASYLHALFSDREPDIILTTGAPAADFVVQFRQNLFPGTPVVLAAVNQQLVPYSALSANDAVAPVNIDLIGAIENILQVLPDTNNIAVVMGNSRHEQNFVEQMRTALQPLANRVTFTWFNELSFNEMMQRAAKLPPHSAIFWLALIVDAAGASHQEFDAMTLLRAVANAPIFSFVDAYLGKGIVGGPLISVRDVGQAAAHAAVRILDGGTPGDVKTLPIVFGTPKFDWRELQRWNISESRLPPGSKVLFRPPTAWDQYRWQIILIATAFLLQSALIAGLGFEHRRRRNAEILARRSMGELANMNRVATAGELSASIAHEMKQPLAAMVTNVRAGLRWLGAAEPNLEETRVALQNVVKDGNRAAEVIDTVRAMFKKEQTERTPLNLNDLIRSVLYLLRDELQPQHIILRTNLDPQLPPVQGHRGELQQVILNLVRNAADAMKDITYRPRVLTIKSETQPPNDVLISIADSGSGIDPKDIDHIFDAFFTTKSNGMGMGLSICKSIIDDHGGRLWASPNLKHGSVFNVSLPIDKAASQSGKIFAA
jgi:signal transduction histidine kinase